MSSALQNHKQLLVVTTPSWNATQGYLQRYEDGVSVGEAIPVVVGKNGMTKDKKEGDLKSPAGTFSLGSAFGFHPKSSLKFPYFQIISTIVAVDDPDSSYYNTIVDESITDCDWKSGEKMAQEPLYELGLVINYNTPNPVKGAGSAIFMHIWRSPTHGTSGCTAMSLENLDKLLYWLDPKASPILIQYPQSEFALQENGLQH